MAEANIKPTKACSQCGEVKPLDQFYAQRDKRDGKRADCAECSRARRRRYYHRNAGVERERYLAWRERNPNWQREWFAANEERQKAKAAEYYRANVERYRANGRRWRETNTDRARELDREFYYRRKQNDRYRLSRSISSCVYRSLKSGKGGRPTFELLGYGLDELVAHLERQFLRGMSWANYGEWHVDHIVPLSSFNYAAPGDPDFRRAWALTNLRPMWGKENYAKGAKRLTLL